ncbi:MAG: choice-of-anchor Q domain-containing protein, partial [Kiritimatiellia bacterium]
MSICMFIGRDRRIVMILAGMAASVFFSHPVLADLTNRYVVKGNAGVIPYDTLAKAAGDIQTAINYASIGETVLVAAATYDSGGITNWPSGGRLTNRVAVTKAITVRSLNNDPASTIIKGAWNAAATNGPDAVRCVYLDNNSSLIGFTLTGGATLTTNETYSSSSDRNGGGIYSPNATTIISNCVIALNSTVGNGGGAYYGACYNSVISNNAAYDGGGAYYGAFYNCTVITNRARYGGGIESAGIVSNCTISFNYASDNGGGVRQCRVLNSTIVSNRAGYGWGSVTCIMSNSVMIGNGATYGAYYNCLIINGGMYGINSATVYRNLTLVNGSYFYTDVGYTNAPLNCISCYADNRVVATNSRGIAGALDNYTNAAYGNTTNDPMFVDTNAGNFRLSAGSPCINAGTNQDWMTNAVDLDGLPRILFGTVDMGSHEAAYAFSYGPAAFTNTVMRGCATNMIVSLSNAIPEIPLCWGTTITSSWVSCPAGGDPVPASGSSALTLTNSSLGLSPGTYVSRMIVSALTNYPLAMEGYSQTGAVDMVLHVAEFARNPTQVVATVRQFANTNRTLTIWNSGSGDIPYRLYTNTSWLAAEPSSGVLTGNTEQAISVSFTNTALPLGVYYGALTLVPGISGEPFEVNVELTVTTGPRMTMTPLSLARTVMVGQSPEGQSLYLSNASTSEVINCRVDWDQSWLSVSPSNSIILMPGATSALAVSYSTSGLTTNISGQSNYNAIITVTATNTDTIGSPASASVTVTVNPKARLAKDVISITNIVTEGYDAPSKTFKVWNSSGYYTLQYTLSDNVDWLVLSPSSGMSSGEEDTITAEFSTERLTPGISNAVITIVGRTFDGIHSDSSADATQQVAVTVLVTPLATLATDSLGEYTISARYGQPAGGNSFRVWNETTGGGSLNYSIASDSSWLAANPSSGTSSGEKDTIGFSCNAAGLKPGRYSAVLSVSALDSSTGTEANNSPTNIGVMLVITANSGFDFAGDGSGASDLVVYKESTGAWDIRN